MTRLVCRDLDWGRTKIFDFGGGKNWEFWGKTKIKAFCHEFKPKKKYQNDGRKPKRLSGTGESNFIGLKLPTGKDGMVSRGKGSCGENNCP